VRKLAEESQEAAAQITQLIGEIQAEIAASAQSLAGTAAELDQLVRRFTVAA
jgi:methyl-accepting chemotaxis protein